MGIVCKIFFLLVSTPFETFDMLGTAQAQGVERGLEPTPSVPSPPFDTLRDHRERARERVRGPLY